MGRIDDFEIVVSFTDDTCVARVGGEVDLLTAPFLRAGLESLVDERHDLVLDLARVPFIDASGLGVIADISARLATAGRVLTVRSATGRTLWLLHISKIDEVVRLDAGSPDEALLGPEQLAGDTTFAVGLESDELAGDLVRVGAKANTTGLDAALRRVTAIADITVEGADGVSVTLERNGRLATVASSNDTVLRMDHHQYETGEGPCLAAASEGRWFHIESLAGETRWPTFVPLAMHEGIASILSSPLVKGERAIGALNIYSNTERVFGVRQQELAAMFATQITELLSDAPWAATDTEMAARISSALHARETIARAQGIVMVQQHKSAEQATAFLHRAARGEQTTVLRQAKTIVEVAGRDDGPPT